MTLLTAQEQLAAKHLARGESIEYICSHAGFTEDQLRTLRETPEFGTEVSRRQEEDAEQLGRIETHAVLVAYQTAVGIMRNPAEPSPTRIAAARVVLAKATLDRTTRAQQELLEKRASPRGGPTLVRTAVVRRDDDGNYQEVA